MNEPTNRKQEIAKDIALTLKDIHERLLGISSSLPVRACLPSVELFERGVANRINNYAASIRAEYPGSPKAVAALVGAAEEVSKQKCGECLKAPTPDMEACERCPIGDINAALADLAEGKPKGGGE